MKSILFLFRTSILCFISIFSLHAQSIPSEVEFSEAQNVLSTLYEPFTNFDTPSGILYGQSLFHIRESYYQSTASQDTIQHNQASFEILYYSMYANRTNSNSWLVHPNSSINSIFDQFESTTNTFSPAIASFKYHHLDSMAYINGDLSINTANQLQLANGVQWNEVLDSSIVYSSVLPKEMIGINMDIILDTSSFFGNIGIQNIYVDAGNGYQLLSHTSTTNIQLGGYGIHLVKLKIIDEDGNIIVHYHKINAKESGQGSGPGLNPHNDPDFVDGVGVYPNSNFSQIFGPNDELFVTFRLQCGGTNISSVRKPLIILDGMDLTWDQNLIGFNEFYDRLDIWNHLNFESGTITLREYMDNNQYDIIFVDYSDHHLPIQQNAEALQELLNAINQAKSNNGSEFENIILGFSMGGVIVKYALLDMEQEEIAHNTESLFTFDSPLQGANVPLALQGLLFQLEEIRMGFEEAVDEEGDELIDLNLIFAEALTLATSFYDVLQEPAPKQLLIYQFKDESDVDPFEQDYLDFYTELENMGELQFCDLFTIANGSELGTAGHQGLDSSPLFSVDFDSPNIFNLDDVEAFILWLLNMDIEITGNQSNPNNNNNTVYDGKIKIKPKLKGIFDKIKSDVVKEVLHPNYESLDNAPGGFLGAPDDIIGALNIDGFELISPFRFCFVPSVSALDVQHNSSFMIHPSVYEDLTDQDDVFASLRHVAENNATEMDQLLQNTFHVSLNIYNVSFLANEMDGNSTINTEIFTTNRIFNFGQSEADLEIAPYTPTKTSDHIYNDVTVVSDAEIWVNRNGLIGFQDDATSPDDLNSEDSHFDLMISGLGCTSTDRIKVEIEDDAAFRVGEHSVDNTAKVTVGFADLVFKEGSRMHIDQNSVIKISK